MLENLIKTLKNIPSQHFMKQSPQSFQSTKKERRKAGAKEAHSKIKSGKKLKILKTIMINSTDFLHKACHQGNSINVIKSNAAMIGIWSIKF